MQRELGQPASGSAGDSAGARFSLVNAKPDRGSGSARAGGAGQAGSATGTGSAARTGSARLGSGRAAGALGGSRPASRAKDRKSTRLNSSHVRISYAVFCLKKKKKTNLRARALRCESEDA